MKAEVLKTTPTLKDRVAGDIQRNARDIGHEPILKTGNVTIVMKWDISNTDALNG